MKLSYRFTQAVQVVGLALLLCGLGNVAFAAAPTYAVDVSNRDDDHHDDHRTDDHDKHRHHCREHPEHHECRHEHEHYCREHPEHHECREDHHHRR